MKYKFFNIPVLNTEQAETELNNFCTQHRIAHIDKQFVANAENSFWSICVTWLQNERDLQIKPNIQIQASKQGVTYCGFRLTQGSTRLTRRRKRRYQERRQYWEALYRQGVINAMQLQAVYASVHAITSNTDSRGWRKKNLKLHPALTL